jgi:hypothetical protein
VSCDGRFRRRVCSCWYGEFRFGLVWCGLNGCEVFKQEIVEIVAWCSSKRLWRYWCIVQACGWLGVRCLVLGSFPFHSIPSVSAAEEFSFRQCPRMREGGVQKAVVSRGSVRSFGFVASFFCAGFLCCFMASW